MTKNLISQHPAPRCWLRLQSPLHPSLPGYTSQDSFDVRFDLMIQSGYVCVFFFYVFDDSFLTMASLGKG